MNDVSQVLLKPIYIHRSGWFPKFNGRVSHPIHKLHCGMHEYVQYVQFSETLSQYSTNMNCFQEQELHLLSS